MDYAGYVVDDNRFTLSRHSIHFGLADLDMGTRHSVYKFNQHLIPHSKVLS